MARSINDLLGESEPSAPKNTDEGESDWGKIRSGVSIAWLAGALRVDPKTVRKRLGPLKPERREAGVDKYEIGAAMSYIVPPRFNVKDYLKTMNPNELPPMLRKEYWDAENKRVNFEERVGELWSTDSVVTVLAEAFMIIKNQVQVWADDIERDAGLTPEQYAALQGRVDILRNALFDALCGMMKTSHRGSAREEGPTADDDADEEG